METKPNWLVRHINLITAAVTLYPWLLMILLLWDNQRHHQHGYAALGAAIAILFLLALTSGMNVLISSLVIFVARCSTPPLASGAAVRFCAMNSISVLWLIPWSSATDFSASPGNGLQHFPSPGCGLSGGFAPGENLRQAAAPLGARHNGLGEHLLVGIE